MDHLRSFKVAFGPFEVEETKCDVGTTFSWVFCRVAACLSTLEVWTLEMELELGQEWE